MDDLLRDFLTETGETLDVVDAELVRLEREPRNRRILDNVFRLVHTIKGTCGFLGLPRLEALTHAVEALLGNIRDGDPVSADVVSLVLAGIDRIKMVVGALERTQKEPAGDDRDLIARLERIGADKPPRPLRPGQISLTELGRALRAAQTEEDAASRDGVQRSDAGASPEAGRAALSNPTIRVHVATLEHIMTMVSELVLTRNQLVALVRGHEGSDLKSPLQRLSQVTAGLQEGVLKTRMQPIGSAWHKLPRLVRDLSTELGKAIELEMYGADTELDRQVLELIRDPLTHMVRNAADHGLESAAHRRAAGKHERGTIRLSASHQGGHVVIEIADDGHGLDLERIRAKAVALGLFPEAEIARLSDAQVQKLIFAPGFSTVDTVTRVSGRGIGLDVVRANVGEIGGTIDVASVPGCGSTFSIKIPLTLAIVPALIVEAGGDRFAIPQLAVLELVRARDDKEHRIERIKDAPVLRLRDRLLPVIDLARLVGTAAPGVHGGGFIVVTQAGNQVFGMVVDRVLQTEEIVVKPMSSKLRHIAMFSGTTILGDGSVILIIDPGGVAQNIGAVATARPTSAEDASHPQDTTEPLLVFCAGPGGRKAVPISLVTRIEEIDAARIESSGGRRLVQYRGQLMPLVPADDEVRIRTSGTQALLVFSDERRSMGLLVDEVVDIVEDRLDIELGSAQPGLLGSAVIKGRATDIIDVAHFLPLALGDWLDRSGRGARARQRRLLLVDDAAFFRNMLAPVLRAAGYAVTGVASAREALALLAGDPSFDVVVTDVEMPDMDGLELAAALRSDPRTAELPVIGLSSLEPSAASVRSGEVGLRGCVAKFDRPGLIAVLQEQAGGKVRAA
jgi:two-component system chemotaxis sensor kinase CheA